MSRCFSCVLTVCLLLNALPATAGDWPQFRGPRGDGHAEATGLPTTWSEAENITWKAPLPGEGWSSPVIMGNQIWLTTATNEGKSLRAIAVSLDKGEILHNQELFTLPATPEKHPTNSHASPTPVLEPGRVYVHFGTHGTACLDTDSGAILWKNETLHCDHEVGPGSSPLMFGKLLLLHFDGIDVQYVVALNKETGRVAWKKERTGEQNPSPSQRKAFSTPIIIRHEDRDTLISPAADRVFGYDPATGEQRWVVQYPGFSNVPRPLFGHGLLFICTGYMKPELWAIRPNGTGDVTDSHVAWKVTKQVPANPSPLLIDDALYMVSDNGVATCLDAKTGEPLWMERLTGNFSASPIYADGKIFFFDQAGKTTVIEPGDEFKLLATNQLDDPFRASPAAIDRALILRTTKHLYRIEQRAR